MLKLGCSTRSYILSGPEDDAEVESEFTVTELKQKRAEELLKREEEAREAEKRKEEMRKKEEERGIDWGLGKLLIYYLVITKVIISNYYGGYNRFIPATFSNFLFWL